MHYTQLFNAEARKNWSVLILPVYSGKKTREISPLTQQARRGYKIGSLSGGDDDDNGEIVSLKVN